VGGRSSCIVSDLCVRGRVVLRRREMISALSRKRALGSRKVVLDEIAK
jgi:hypothetical protein